MNTYPYFRAELRLRHPVSLGVVYRTLFQLRFARICSSFCTGQSRVINKHTNVSLIEKALAPEVQAFKISNLCHETNVCIFAPMIHVRWRDGPHSRKAENARLCRATLSHTAADSGCSSSCGMFNIETGFPLSENAYTVLHCKPYRPP